MNNKICIVCSLEKTLDNFSFINKTGKLNNKCKSCINEYVKAYTKSNKNRISIQRKEFRENNKARLANPKNYIVIDNKTCSICSENKNITEFNKNKRSIDGHKAQCKSCTSKLQLEYRKNNPEIQKQYRIKNSKILNKKLKIKRNLNIEHKLRCNLRTRLWEAIKNNYKSGSAVSDLGCSIQEFKKYIESKFSDGMTWDNWGRDTWHLDHIKPLSKFNLSNRNEFLIAVNYNNIQPMLAYENLKKGASI